MKENEVKVEYRLTKNHELLAKVSHKNLLVGADVEYVHYYLQYLFNNNKRVLKGGWYHSTVVGSILKTDNAIYNNAKPVSIDFVKLLVSY